MKTTFILIIFVYSLSYMFSWGPFESCGVGDPENLNDCDKFSIKTGIGCCLLTEVSNNNKKSCLLIGGRAQGFFNTQST